MSELTNIEITLLKDLHSQAESLENGAKGNIEVMCSVVAKTAKVVVAMARTGGVSPVECELRQATCLKNVRMAIADAAMKSDWKAKLAVWVPLSAALMGIGLKVLSL